MFTLTIVGFCFLLFWDIFVNFLPLLDDWQKVLIIYCKTSLKKTMNYSTSFLLVLLKVLNNINLNAPFPNTDVLNNFLNRPLSPD